MAKAASVWECQQCGAQFPKWAGKCPDCGKWNTLVETVVSTKFKVQSSLPRRQAGKFKVTAQSSKPRMLSEILKQQDKSPQRISSGIGELDRVLGGGLVPGQVVLLAGEPGMGKSTLLSQVALAMAVGYQSSVVGSRFQVNQFSVDQSKTNKPINRLTDKQETENRKQKTDNRTVLYVCGEESPSQVALRLGRLLDNQQLTINNQQLVLFPETDVDAVIAEIERQFGYQSSVVGYRSQVSRSSVSRSETGKPKTDEPETENRKLKTDNGIVIIDSIQTLSTADLSGLAGSVGQIRESTGRLSQVAKSLNIPLFLVGHVTKEGEVAGPKVLEHMVDTVLVMEGDRSGNLRILRSLKNRFGPVDEVGIFSMDDNGMAEVKNPAELLVGDLAAKAPGSVLGCVLEGQRPLVLEIQALAVPTKLSFPRRVGNGISERRLQLLCAVIEKHLGLGIGEKDVFVNVAGGLKSADPGLDLPVVAAIVSSAAQKSQLKSAEIGKHRIADRSEKVGSGLSGLSAIRLSADASRSKPTFPIFCGEVGLLGEVRMVPGWPRREKEVKRLGMGKLIGKPDIGHIGQLQKFL